MRKISFLDRILIESDAALRTLAPPKKRPCKRHTPAEDVPDTSLNITEKRHVAGLMRVNHAGEVCAQALYRGQALTATLGSVKVQMQHAAEEEIDHLAWCELRLHELSSNPSLFAPFWYWSSFLIGAFAGLMGDQWSLGFVAETERQVSNHLENHLRLLPESDNKTRAILAQMYTDEIAHATMARQAGAATLPPLIQKTMYAISKLLTQGSYYL